MAGNGSAQPLAGLFAHLGGLRELERVLLRRRENGSGQRMLRVALQTRHEGQHFPLREARGDELLRQLRLAIRERPGLVENRGPTPGDLLEHDGALDDDRPAGAEGNRTDDGDGDGEQQRARRGDDQHRQEANRFATDHPGQEGHGQGHRSVNGPQLIAQPPQLRPLGLGLAHDFHDLRVARIGGALGRANGQGRLAVDRARDHRRAGGLGDLERLAREIGFIHHAVALDHHAVRRTDLMRINHERVAHRNLRQRHIQHFRRAFPVGDRRHPFGQRGQHRRGAAQRVTLQRFTSGEHQDDDRASQVFAQQDGSNDGNTAQQIGTEFPLQELPKQVIEKRQAAESERGQQGNLVSARSGVEAEAKHQMQKDGRDGKRRDDRGLAVPETGRRIPGPTGRLWIGECDLRNSQAMGGAGHEGLRVSGRSSPSPSLQLRRPARLVERLSSRNSPRGMSTRRDRLPGATASRLSTAG